MKSLIEKFLDIILSILSFFFNKEKRTHQKKVELINQKKADIEFKSKVEAVAKQAESSDSEKKAQAIEEMRKLISE